MSDYRIAEIFSSINGEGMRAGQLATFIRFCGCNLNCTYCDTAWANQPDSDFQIMTASEIITSVKNLKNKNITITGGEPLIQPDIKKLLEALAESGDFCVEIETNGSVLLEPFCSLQNKPSFTMDYKLPGSGMENCMETENFRFLTAEDTVKFVVGNNDDLLRAKEIIDKFGLSGQCHLYISPVFGKIDPVEIVCFMKANQMDGVNLQLQMHKIIWDSQMRGV